VTEPTLTCDLCGSPMYETRHCTNPECVQSARLIATDEVVQGSFAVDGPYTALLADGTWEGEFRILGIDPKFANAIVRAWTQDG
jgi:hypothetical protein